MQRSKEKDIDLEFVVRIKAYGKPVKIKRDIGRSLAKLCGLNFKFAEVSSGKTVYGWHVLDHVGGGLDDVAEDVVGDVVDGVNDTGVVS